MDIPAELVKRLRDRTGAGFMECKAALEEAQGDIEKAITVLRKKGLASAAKKAGRTAKDGAIAAHIADQGRTGVLVEVNCETDFVAKTDEFKDLVTRVAAHIASYKPARVRAEDLGEGPALYEQMLEDGNITWSDFIAEK